MISYVRSIKVAPEFSYKSSTGAQKEREAKLRELWVRAMEARLVRDELGKCQQAEGVNHYENCAWLSQKYLGMLRESRVCFFVISLQLYAVG